LDYVIGLHVGDFYSFLLMLRWRMKSLKLQSQPGAEVAAESSAVRYLVIILVYSYSEVLVVF